jgi:hypothetical protein
MFKDIRPSGIDLYQGRVLFYRYIVAGDNVFPCPRQSDSYEDLTSYLIYRELTEELLFVAKILEWEIYFIINIVWALTGGLEVKAAEEVCEKYVARAIFKTAIKYIKPKFLAIVKGYMEGFVKELAAQAFKLSLSKARQAASARLASTVSAKGSAITVEQIHLIRSSADLKGSHDKSLIDWKKCHLKGMEEGLKRIWQIIPVKDYANESFRRAFDTCMKYIDKFFFDIKIKAVVEKGQEKLSEKIYELVAETVTEWAIKAAGGKEQVTAESAEQKVRQIALQHLADGTIFDLANKYIQENWDSLVKQALDAAQGEIVKAMKGALPRTPIADKVSGTAAAG